MNGRPLPEGHGAPLRAIVPGWYATDSVKWLTRIAVLDAPFDGPFEVDDYRLRDRRGGGGERLTVLPVSSLTTSHSNGARIAPGTHQVRGVAWSGDGGIQRVEVSFDRRDWEEAAFSSRAQPYGFTRWSLEWLAEPGLRTIAVRATDGSGATQPPQPRWNEGGYANSSIQLVRLLVG
jgi:DMSO/TMAO reductase YedYZ molybdopterin-dependent catalytic subunit